MLTLNTVIFKLILLILRYFLPYTLIIQIEVYQLSFHTEAFDRLSRIENVKLIFS